MEEHTEEIFKSLAQIPGIDSWRGEINVVGHSTEFLFKNGNNTINIHLGMTPKLPYLFHTHPVNIGWLENINKLREAGYKITAKLAIYSSSQFTPTSARGASAIKGPIRIGICYYGGFEYRVFAKLSIAKHFRYITSAPDLSIALARAASEAHKLEGKNSLPTPCTFCGPNILVDKRVHTFSQGNKEVKTYSRCSIILNATVLGIMALRPDHCFVDEASDPANKNIWVVIDVQTLNGYQYKIAVNGNEWYSVAGTTYLCISPDPPINLRFTLDDFEFIKYIISEYTK